MLVDTRLTYDDYCLLPNDGKRYEIIDGELFVSPSPATAHQNVVANLLYHLMDFVRKHALGKVYTAPLDVVFSQFDVVEPDLLYISKSRSSILTRANVQGAPDLIVEVVSESTGKIDRTTKLKLYARFGVKEYWIIDPLALTAEVFRAQPEGLELTQQLSSKDSLNSPLLPGFALPLEKLSE
ncbi:MAG: Uma2 family endonuclease [Terriglobia bacterium]